jgi:HEAT repeat protein
MGHPDYFVRGQAADALAGIGEAALPTLIEQLQAEGPQQRQAAFALADMGPAAKAAVPELWCIVEDDAADIELVRSAADAAGRIDLPALIARFDRPEMIDQAWTSDVLGYFRDAALPTLIRRLEHDDPTVRANAAEELRSAGPKAKAAVPALARMLGDEYAKNRRESLWALGNMGVEARPAIPQITKTLADEDEVVRDWSAWALGEMGPEAIESVPALVDRFRHEESIDVRRRAASALSKIGPAAHASVPALLEHLRDADPHIQAAAADALGPILCATVEKQDSP